MIPTKTRATIRGSLKRSLIERNSDISRRSFPALKTGVCRSELAEATTSVQRESSSPITARLRPTYVRGTRIPLES